MFCWLRLLHGVTFLRWIALVSSRHPIAMARESSPWSLITYVRWAVLRGSRGGRGDVCLLDRDRRSDSSDTACVSARSSAERVTRTPVLDPTVEAELLVELGRGERTAVFEKLVRAMRERVFTVCLNVTTSRNDAEDATQETFVSAYRALPAFRGEAQLSTWLYRRLDLGA